MYMWTADFCIPAPRPPSNAITTKSGRSSATVSKTEPLGCSKVVPAPVTCSLDQLTRIASRKTSAASAIDSCVVISTGDLAMPCSPFPFRSLYLSSKTFSPNRLR